MLKKEYIFTGKYKIDNKNEAFFTNNQFIDETLIPVLKQLNDKPLKKTSYYKQYIIDYNIRGNNRSITSSKVANAMANQWG